MSDSPTPEHISVTGSKNNTRILCLEGDATAEEIISIFAEYLEGLRELGKIDQNYLAIRTNETLAKRIKTVGDTFVAFLEYELVRKKEGAPSLLDSNTNLEKWYAALLVHLWWMDFINYEFGIGITVEKLTTYRNVLFEMYPYLPNMEIYKTMEKFQPLMYRVESFE